MFKVRKPSFSGQNTENGSKTVFWSRECKQGCIGIFIHYTFNLKHMTNVNFEGQIEPLSYSPIIFTFSLLNDFKFQSFFGFGPSADIEIVLDGQESRKTAEIKTEDGKKERHFLYYDGETVAGKVCGKRNSYFYFYSWPDYAHELATKKLSLSCSEDLCFI